MNTKFKFRAWYKPDFKTEDGPLKFIQVTEKSDDSLVFQMEKDSAFIYEFCVPFSDSDWIVEQWTGLKDKNGVEIYEGDIVKATYIRNYFSTDVPKEIIKEVELKLSTNLDIEYGGGPDGHSEYINVEVIGNIHENSELLK